MEDLTFVIEPVVQFLRSALFIYYLIVFIQSSMSRIHIVNNTLWYNRCSISADNCIYRNI